MMDVYVVWVDELYPEDGGGIVGHYPTMEEAFKVAKETPFEHTIKIEKRSLK